MLLGDSQLSLEAGYAYGVGRIMRRWIAPPRASVLSNHDSVNQLNWIAIAQDAAGDHVVELIDGERHQLRRASDRDFFEDVHSHWPQGGILPRIPGSANQTGRDIERRNS